MKSKEEHWERLFKGYERSGLSQEDFCSEQGIPAGTRLALSQKHYVHPRCRLESRYRDSCMLQKAQDYQR